MASYLPKKKYLQLLHDNTPPGSNATASSASSSDELSLADVHGDEPTHEQGSEHMDYFGDGDQTEHSASVASLTARDGNEPNGELLHHSDSLYDADSPGGVLFESEEKCVMQSSTAGAAGVVEEELSSGDDAKPDCERDASSDFASKLCEPYRRVDVVLNTSGDASFIDNSACDTETIVRPSSCLQSDRRQLLDAKLATDDVTADRRVLPSVTSFSNLPGIDLTHGLPSSSSGSLSLFVNNFELKHSMQTDEVHYARNGMPFSTLSGWSQFHKSVNYAAEQAGSLHHAALSSSHSKNTGRRKIGSKRASTDVSDGSDTVVRIKEEKDDDGYELKRAMVTTSGRNRGCGKAMEPKYSCQVCGDTAAGFHCGAYVCEACKKFYLRCLKSGGTPAFLCPKNSDCVIQKDTRSHCQYCRFQKCVYLGMYKPGREDDKKLKIDFKSIPCKVCNAPSSGFHFGAITCEGCKGFFRRMLKEQLHKKFICTNGESCDIDSANRTTCKCCRFAKCLRIGMKLEGTRLGRQSNSVKRSTLMEYSTSGMVQSGGGHGASEDDRASIFSDMDDESNSDGPMSRDRLPIERAILPAARDLLQQSYGESSRMVDGLPSSQASKGSDSLSPDYKPHCSLTSPLGSVSGAQDAKYLLTSMQQRNHHALRVCVGDKAESFNDCSSAGNVYATSAYRNFSPAPINGYSQVVRYPEFRSFCSFKNEVGAEDQLPGPVVYDRAARWPMAASEGPVTAPARWDGHERHDVRMGNGNERLLQTVSGRNEGGFHTAPQTPLQSPASGMCMLSPQIAKPPLGNGLAAFNHELTLNTLQQQQMNFSPHQTQMRMLSPGGSSHCSSALSPQEQMNILRGATTVDGYPMDVQGLGSVGQQQSERGGMSNGIMRGSVSSVGSVEMNLSPTGSVRTPKCRYPSGTTQETLERERLLYQDALALFRFLTASFRELDDIMIRPQELDDLQHDPATLDTLWKLVEIPFMHQAKVVLKFVKKIPGFRQLPVEDQIKMAQDSLYPITLIFHSKYYNLETGEYNWFINTTEERDLILSVLPPFSALANHFRSIGFALKSLELSEEEMAFLTTMTAFTAADGSYLQSSKDVEELQEELLEAFISYQAVMGMAGNNRVATLLARLPELKRANIEHRLVASQVQQMAPQVEMSNLWQEVFLCSVDGSSRKV